MRKKQRKERGRENKIRERERGKRMDDHRERVRERERGREGELDT